jgi:hypothetical protein
MRVVSEYSHLGGLEVLKSNFADEYQEILDVISSVQPEVKYSKDKTKMGKAMYDQKVINKQFKTSFSDKKYEAVKDKYSVDYLDGSGKSYKTFKETDFVKGKVGIEVQFGKYAFMLYDLIKFQYFFNKRKISVGVEIVATKAMVDYMDTGVSFAEQLVSDIERLDRHFPSVPIAIIVVDDDTVGTSDPIMKRRSSVPTQSKLQT